MSLQNQTAHLLRTLHKPGNPIILTNVWDAISAKAIASLPQTQAIATASFAIAAAAGLEDDHLTLDVNLRAIRAIAPIAAAYNKPLTVDFQDGFGDRLEEGIREILKLGVVGINLEDFGREMSVDGGDGKGGLYSISTAQERIRRVMAIAKEEGVPDFVVNARTDALLHGHPVAEVVERGKAYLDAGAANVFVWGGVKRGGMRREEVQECCREFGGRLNVSMKLTPGNLTLEELREIGVARISIGPQLMLKSAGFVAEEARRVLGV
ncbi:PEP phosphonomutase [Lindgomyces ingoldianus]|uniref:PEP phosphonomutase n=1 Tax=Lindgomyces ingoldianus TaxID=673940 RepID=A0ACB6R6F8_9PLEO|nr:PEP phosphonomutase [Lindgomyces ingoldianus]KAF2473900.1 PEP phosphonomutase [Lindgomyces ingoldianus]